MDKLPKQLIHKHCKSSYLVKIDKGQKETLEFGSLNLYTPKAFDRNFRTKNVNECTVVKAYGDADFKEGDVLRVSHWMFQDAEGKWLPPLIKYKGDDLYKLDDTVQFVKTIYWGYRGGQRVLSEGVFITEYLEYPRHDELILINSFTGRRRDVMRIAEIPEKEKDFKVGDYVLISNAADYEIDDSNGKFARVFKDRIWAVLGDDKWMLTKYRPFNNHYKDVRRG